MEFGEGEEVIMDLFVVGFESLAMVLVMIVVMVLILMMKDRCMLCCHSLLSLLLL